MTPAQKGVLRHFKDGPRYIRSLGVFKVVADQLVDAGYLVRCTPKGMAGNRLAGRNMMRLTDGGQKALEALS